MEHRCGERCVLTLPVTLLTGKGDPLRGTVRNVSAGGMFIDGLAESLVPYEFVDIVLTVPGPVTRIWRWPAMVVRSSYGSAALMFDRLRFGDLRRLVRTLRHAPGTAAQLLASGRDTTSMPAGSPRYH